MSNLENPVNTRPEKTVKSTRVLSWDADSGAYGLEVAHQPIGMRRFMLTKDTTCAHHHPQVYINPTVTALDNVSFFAGCPPSDEAPPSVNIQGDDLGIRGDGGVFDLLNDSLVHSERQVFGLALDI